VAAGQNDRAQAAQLARESLALSDELGDRLMVAEGLERLARLAIVERATTGQAVQLLGAAAALREQINAPRSPSGRAEYERTLAAARRQIGETAFAARWDAGHHVTLEEAVATALAGNTDSG
ncbi:MAG TPA: hypothetical protein VFV93_01635, partial [Thermomicrobiales bacterium]|nr:hypothetical protein [Thermomicrobiales bacterium]